MLRGLGLIVTAVLLLASNSLASASDDFQVLLRHTELPRFAHLTPGQALTSDRAQALWRGLLDSPATLRTFGPRTALARLVREALSSSEPVPYATLLARTGPFRRLVVLRPDGYAATALTGRPLASLGSPILRGGELYALGMRVGAFYFNDSGVFYSVDESLQRQGPPVGELPLGRDPATAALLGAENAMEEMAHGMATFFTEPVRTLEGLSQLHSAVAGLICSSPEYFARYGAMNLEDQIREGARLATHVLTLQGGAATAGPKLSAAARVPVMTLSKHGVLALRELTLSAGTATAVVGAGAASASVVLLAQQGGSPATGATAPGPWPPPPQGPGRWIEKTEHMPEESLRYQSQVAGAPPGWVYRIRTGPGPKDYVDFDGFKNGLLLELKGTGYLKLLQKMYGKPWFTGMEEMIEQAQRQLKAARGTPIQWHFAEREVADLMRKLFKEKDLGRIKVVHTPPSS